MPALRGGGGVLGVGKGLEAVGGVLLPDGEDVVRRLAHEVRDGDELAGMSIDEGLEPGASSLVADLEGVYEGGSVVLFREVLERGSGEVLRVELAVELLLSSGDGVRGSDGGLRVGQLGDLDERIAKRDDLVVLVQGYVGDRVREGDAVRLLLDVDVASVLALERSADVHGVEAELAA